MINELATVNSSITYQSVIDSLETMFAEECDCIESFQKSKPDFMRDIKRVADSVQVSMVRSNKRTLYSALQQKKKSFFLYRSMVPPLGKP